MLGDDLREQREGKTEKRKKGKSWRFHGETLRRNDPVARIRYNKQSQSVSPKNLRDGEDHQACAKPIQIKLYHVRRL
jgi:hypothetical protein